MLIQGTLEISKYLDDLFNGYDSDYIANNETLLNGILDYYSSDGGAPEIDGLEITDCDFNTENRTGNMHIDFLVNRYYGCSDLNSSDYDTQKWTFQIDVPNEHITFKGPFEYERDPDTY
jgi:hypothetical protein